MLPFQPFQRFTLPFKPWAFTAQTTLAYMKIENKNFQQCISSDLGAFGSLFIAQPKGSNHCQDVKCMVPCQCQEHVSLLMINLSNMSILGLRMIVEVCSVLQSTGWSVSWYHLVFLFLRTIPRGSRHLSKCTHAVYKA